MIDIADVSLLLAVLAVLLVALLRNLRIIKRHRAKALKYKLFKVRDDLISLVAQEKLDEDDFVFKQYYETINIFLAYAHRVTLSSFVGAMAKAKSKGLDPAADQEVRQLVTALENKEPEVQEVAISFYKAIMTILYEQSRFLQILIRCRPLVRALKRFHPWDGPGGSKSTPIQAYTLHRAYSRAADGIGSKPIPV